MDSMIERTLATVASILKASDSDNDRLTAGILYTLLGCHAANNATAIAHIAEVASDEAQAFVLMHQE